MPVTARQWVIGMWKENMTEAEKKAYDAAKAERHDLAVAKASSGDFPAGIRFKLGDHTLTAHPQGVSEKGGVSYSASPSTIQIGKFHVRINKVSFTVLAGKENTVVEGNMI